jgi:hypothetical protein
VRNSHYAILVVAAALAAAAAAQVDTGAIWGVVTDPSGAVVPGARIVVTQPETNVRFALNTNGSGFYSAPALHPGLYKVEVEKAGFETQWSGRIDLRVQDRVEVDFALALATGRSVDAVTAETPLLESETSSLGQVFESQTIDDLPLNQRTYMPLATLTMGTLPSQRSPDKDAFISNGARSEQNEYLLDGVDNINRIVGFDANTAQAFEPVLDAVEEFKVQTSTFSAEFGHAAGGVVNVALKSGTNDLYGDAFEFLRNSDLDAIPYFQPGGNGKPAYRQNQFGASAGGPIRRNRTFFFAAWQSEREQSQAPQLAVVPTASELLGIFPAKVIDPKTGAPFPNRTIPTSRWDPVAAKLLALYPAPNLPGRATNFYFDPQETVNEDQYDIKLDHHFRDADAIFVRVSQGWNYNLPPTPLPLPANQPSQVNLGQRQVTVGETHAFSQNQVNEFRLAFLYSLENQVVLGPRLFDQFGIKGALDAPNITGLPLFQIVGLSSLGTTGPGVLTTPAAGNGNSPATKSGKVWQMLDSDSWTRGRHVLRFGADASRVTLFAYATNTARPDYIFDTTYTGFGLGDFLLGDVYQGSTSQQQIDTILQYTLGGYVQDDFKVTDKLTLNLGIRYDVATPFAEEHNRQANFVIEPGPCYLQLILPEQTGSCGAGRSQVRTDGNNFAPRAGLAYRAADKTVIRSGFGIFCGRDEDIGISRRLPDNPPFVTAAIFTGTGKSPAFQLENGFAADALSPAPAPFNANTTVNAFPFNFPLPYVEEWNFNIQRELPAGFVAEVGYTGSAAKKLPIVVNVNQPFPGTGSLNSRRPFPGVGDIMYYAPLDNSTYNAFIARLERRFRSLSMLTSYTYGHSIDGGGNYNDSSDPGPQSAHDLQAQKGSSNFDIRHRFVTSAIYASPFRSRGLRNWRLSGIFSAETGLPFTPVLSSDPSNTGTVAYPDRIAGGALPSDQRTTAMWFNTAAFAAPSCICFGNSGRDILRGPGFVDLDLGLMRDFHLGERFRLQVRAESFNLMNHPNFGLPNAVIGSPVAGAIDTTVNPARQNQVALKLYF